MTANRMTPEPADKWVTIPRDRLAELESLERQVREAVAAERERWRSAVRRAEQRELAALAEVDDLLGHLKKWRRAGIDDPVIERAEAGGFGPNARVKAAGPPGPVAP